MQDRMRSCWSWVKDFALLSENLEASWREEDDRLPNEQTVDNKVVRLLHDSN
jgi:hypothetical protein